jgi:hypothetical protein
VPVPTTSGFDLKGPYLQGPPGTRFIYLFWGTVDDATNFELFRRAKLWLDCIPSSEVIASAVDQGLLVGRLGLSDRHGNPLCVPTPREYSTPTPGLQSSLAGSSGSWPAGRRSHIDGDDIDAHRFYEWRGYTNAERARTSRCCTTTGN